MTKETDGFRNNYNLEKIFLKILKNYLQFISNSGILYAHSGRKAQSSAVGVTVS